jgi:hypothetical protein
MKDLARIAGACSQYFCAWLQSALSLSHPDFRINRCPAFRAGFKTVAVGKEAANRGRQKRRSGTG